jgi:hypothetical protein
MGRWLGVADGRADGAGATEAGSVAPGAGAVAALLAAGAAVPVTGVGA